MLFNVGSEAGANAARGSKESIIEIILRIFNEHLGYSNTLWVADFERQLASDQNMTYFVLKLKNCITKSGKISVLNFVYDIRKLLLLYVK